MNYNLFLSSVAFPNEGNSLMQPAFQSLYMDLLNFQHQSIACLSKKVDFKEAGEK
jgi:hypothetical protein